MSKRKGPHRAPPGGYLTAERVVELTSLLSDEHSELGPLDRQDLQCSLAELQAHRRRAGNEALQVGPAIIAADGVVVATDIQREESKAA
jgi:ABC-type proline/glycine betaine transport system ATPase subunit